MMTNFGQFEDDKQAPQSEGNLLEPMEQGRGISGGWISQEQETIAKVAAGLVTVGGVVLLANWVKGQMAPPPPPSTMDRVKGFLLGAAERLAILWAGSQIGGLGKKASRAAVDVLPLPSARRP